MHILVIGNGGREHTIAWCLARSPQTTRVSVAPGNAGTALEDKVENVAIEPTDIPALISFAKTHAVDFTVVGPEAPLAAGIVDAFQREGLLCLGPTQACAQLEASKAFSKAFMQQHGVPTAAYQEFTDITGACAYLKTQTFPIVIKADGLAAGKGVYIIEDLDTGLTVLSELMQSDKLGDAGNKVVIEDFITGEEASFIALVDGDTILPLASSQDHKARDNGDKGPNTGGMGAYSPAPVVDATLEANILKQVMEPVVAGMKAAGTPYTGFLYAGIMIDQNGTPQTLEFNCRLGDPETQAILPRLKTDFVTLCLAALNKKLNDITLTWDARVAVGVVLTAGGYPDAYRKGDVITGLDTIDNTDTKVFHAGTTLDSSGEHVLTNGGRVLCVTALGDNVVDAQRLAYQQADKIQWKDIYYRTDIGHRAIARETQDV